MGTRRRILKEKKEDKVGLIKNIIENYNESLGSFNKTILMILIVVCLFDNHDSDDILTFIIIFLGMTNCLFR